jgi:hypothetical protein
MFVHHADHAKEQLVNVSQGSTETIVNMNTFAMEWLHHLHLYALPKEDALQMTHVHVSLVMLEIVMIKINFGEPYNQCVLEHHANWTWKNLNIAFITKDLHVIVVTRYQMFILDVIKLF